MPETLGKGIPEIEIPPVESSAEAVAGEEVAAMEPPAPPVAAATAAMVVPGGLNAGLNGFGGSPAPLILDKRVRVIPHAVDSSVVEHYRKLRTKLLQKRDEKPFRSLLVTSANPKEGKTITSLNLALSFAMLPNFKVVVVDGDFRRGSLGNWLGMDRSHPGLSDVVEGTARLEDVVLKSDQIPIHFILRGTARVLDAHRSQFDAHFRKLGEHFDLVIVDSPPANLLADVQILAGSCDAVLLVARSFVTNRSALEKAVQDLQPFNVIGTVLNASVETRKKYYYGYY